MKKLVCLLLMMLLALPLAAQANEWGAVGDTVSLFDGTAYEDYTTAAEDYARGRDDLHLIVHSRYHQQLLVARREAGEWQVQLVTTLAVRQPDDPLLRTNWPRLARDGEGFELRYGPEFYRFDAQLELTGAACNGLTFTLLEDGAYRVQQGESATLWHPPLGLQLSSFNISLMPRSVEEAARLDRLYALAPELLCREPRTPGGGKQAVYAAPGDKAWRAAKGKASVNLNDGEGLYTFGVAEGGWELIGYQVSLRTGRVGYARTGAADAPAADLGWLALAAQAAADTYLTDDPDVSQFAQARLSAGTPLTLLSGYRWDYAYVEALVDGKPCRGFVPLRDIALRDDAHDVAAADLPGEYVSRSGGSPLGPSVTFRPDGDFATSDGRTGRWEITAGENGLALRLLEAGSEAVTLPITLRTQGLSIGPGAAHGDYQRK